MTRLTKSSGLDRRVEREQARIQRRIGWLRGKASRLPARSNNRANAIHEARNLARLHDMLAHPPKVKQLLAGGAASRHEHRATVLLNELVAARHWATKKD